MAQRRPLNLLPRPRRQLGRTGYAGHLGSAERMVRIEPKDVSKRFSSRFAVRNSTTVAFFKPQSRTCRWATEIIDRRTKYTQQCKDGKTGKCVPGLVECLWSVVVI